MSSKSKYDPSNISQYFGKTFMTKRGSLYKISNEGRFIGRPSIEGADVMLIAGVDGELFEGVRDCLNKLYHGKKELDNLILKYGQKPQSGLHLVISLTPESAKQKDRYGLISSLIDRIK